MSNYRPLKHRQYYEKDGTYSGRYCPVHDSFPNHQGDNWMLEWLKNHRDCGVSHSFNEYARSVYLAKLEDES